MKTRLLGALVGSALVGFAISFALPTFAQQKETVDPKLGEAEAAFEKKMKRHTTTTTRRPSLRSTLTTRLK